MAARLPSWRLTPIAYSFTCGDSSPFGIRRPTPGTCAATVDPIFVQKPFASRPHASNTIWIAVGVSMRLAAFGSVLIAGPLYAHWYDAGAPACEDESAIVLATAETY